MASLSPDAAPLDGFATEVSPTDGIGLADLDPITTLLVRTQNSRYQIVVVQPRLRAVLVQGGPFFPQATRAVLSGSNFGGSLLKVAWVGIGLHMEFRAGDQWIITSRVQAITVQPERALPGPF